MSVRFSRFVDVKGQSELFGSNVDGKSLSQNLTNVGLDVADAQVHISCLSDRKYRISFQFRVNIDQILLSVVG